MKFRAMRKRFARKRKGFQGSKSSKKIRKVDNAEEQGNEVETLSIVEDDVTKNARTEKSADDAVVEKTAFKELANRSAEKLHIGCKKEEGNLWNMRSRLKESRIEKAQGFKLVDSSQLEAALNSACVCRVCKKKLSKIELFEQPKKRKGLMESLVVRCKSCKIETELKTSKTIMLSSQPVPEVNIRSV